MHFGISSAHMSCMAQAGSQHDQIWVITCIVMITVKCFPAHDELGMCRLSLVSLQIVMLCMYLPLQRLPAKIATESAVIGMSMQNAGSCDMTAGMDTSESESYMMRECSPGHYGPVCSLCLMNDVPPGHTKYGRTGPLECKPCR